MNLRKGISPVIATVIIVAVALAIAIAVVGWIMGIWGAVTGGTELLKLYPDSYINASYKYIVLHIKNEGGGTAVIYKIEVSGLGAVSSGSTGATFVSSVNTDQLSETLTSVAVDVGSEIYIYGKISADTLTPGAIYTVRIYTKAGNVYTAQVQAK